MPMNASRVPLQIDLVELECSTATAMLDPLSFLSVGTETPVCRVCTVRISGKAFPPCRIVSAGRPFARVMSRNPLTRLPNVRAGRRGPGAGHIICSVPHRAERGGPPPVIDAARPLGGNEMKHRILIADDEEPARS